MKQRTVIIRGRKHKQNPDAKWAKLARKARGTDSNVRLAERMKTSVWTIWMWCHGVTTPRPNHQKKLRKLIG